MFLILEGIFFTVQYTPCMIDVTIRDYFNDNDGVPFNDILFTFISTRNPRRHGHLYDFWAKNAYQKGYKLLIMVDSPGSFKEIPFLRPNKVYYQYAKYNAMRDDIDRAAKRLTACEYFLQETKLSWLWTVTDDVFVNVDRIPKMLRYLNSKHNSNHDVVIYGDCMARYDFKPFLQGGIGYIMSRAAAKKFIELGPKWINNISRLDDRQFNDILINLNIKPSEAKMPWGIGHNFDPKYTNGIPDDVPLCNLSYYEPECGRGLYPMSDIVGIHHSDDRTAMEMAKSIFEGSNKYDDLFWHPDYEAHPYICRVPQELKHNYVFE